MYVRLVKSIIRLLIFIMYMSTSRCGLWKFIKFINVQKDEFSHKVKRKFVKKKNLRGQFYYTY